MSEKMTSKIAQVTIRVTGVWEDEEGNSYPHEKEFVLQINTETIKDFKQFNKLAEEVASSMKHSSICSALMNK